MIINYIFYPKKNKRMRLHSYHQNFNETNQNNEYNSHGRILSDITNPFLIRTQRYQYENKKPCLQNTPNILQNNYFNNYLPDKDLVDMESELRGITRYYSKLPSSKYQGFCTGTNDKNIPVCINKNPISQKCSIKQNNKIIPGQFYNDTRPCCRRNY